MPWYLSFVTRISWFKVSKAFDISKKTDDGTFCWSISCRIISVSSVKLWWENPLVVSSISTKLRWLKTTIMFNGRYILINIDFLNNPIFTVSYFVAQIYRTFPCHLQNPVFSWNASDQGPYQLCYVQRDQDTHIQNGQLLYNDIQPCWSLTLCDLCPDSMDSVT